MKGRKTTGERLEKLLNSYTLDPVVAFHNETICVFPSDNPQTCQWFGVGRIIDISKGDKFDIVRVSFQIRPNKLREIVITNNHARRQILTLKKGQFAMFNGEAKLYSRKMTKGKTKFWQLFGWLASGFYVPKMFDVRQHEKDIDSGEEIEQITEMSQEKKVEYENIVNDLFETDMNEFYLEKLEVKER